MRIHPLAGCDAKLCGARKQLVVLEEQWEAFLDGEPYSVTFRHNPQTPHNVTVVVDPLDPPPLELAVTLGHVVHDLRSALDHLVCRFVDPLGSADDIRNAFPIFLLETEFDGQLLLPGEKKGRGRLEGIDPGSYKWALIEKSQPYKSGARAKEHPLWILNCLWNRDKHRALNSVLGYPDPVELRESIVWDPLQIATPRYKSLGGLGKPVVNETALAEFWFDPVGPVPKMYVKGQLPFEPAFSYDDGVVTRAGIQEILKVVEAILSLARPAFSIS